MVILPVVLAAIKRDEGFVDHVYLDGGGVPTIGYGTTSADVSPLPSRITEPQASALLLRMLERKYAPAVDRLNLPNPNMQGACLSIAYNCGPGVLGSGFTLGRALEHRDWHAAASAFGLYVHDARGVVEPGLVARRRWEQQLFGAPYTPPDPHRYLWFPVQAIHVEGQVLYERQTVMEYDALRPHAWWHRRTLHKLQDRMRLLGGRVDEIYREKPGLDAEMRLRWRRDQLRARASGRRLV